MKRLAALGISILVGVLVYPAAAQKGAEPSSQPSTSPAGKPEATNRSADKPRLSAKDYVRIADALRPSFVVVEYSLQFDKGEAPYGGGWLPGYGYQGLHLGEIVRQERTLSVSGVLLSTTEVLTADPMIHPRFLKSLCVRVGGETVPAKVERYACDQFALILRLDRPVQGAAPLAFSARGRQPYFAVAHEREAAVWTLRVKPLAMAVTDPEGRRPFVPVQPYCLIVDRRGKAVGMSMNGEIAVDTSWKGSPAKWKYVTREDLTRMLEDLAKAADAGLLRVTLRLRSPSKNEPQTPYTQYQEDNETEKQVVGVLTAPTTLLVLAKLDPKVTARLEGIEVHLGPNKSVEATFAHTLKDYGALVATLKTPLPGALALSQKDITKYENLLLPMLELRIQGDKRVPYYQHLRIVRFSLGWRDHVYPEILISQPDVFLFDTDRTLLALPILRREKTLESRYERASPALTAAAYLRDILAKPQDHADASNIPLREEEENRLAWLGALLQPLGEELARMNKVSDLTLSGRTGALVSYVYSDSPAAQAGIQPGDVLLRLYVEDEPKPIDIRVEPPTRSYFPDLWQRYDEMPEQVFDRIPRPWPSAENLFTRTLTDLGFGKKFDLEYFHDGKILRKDFTVTQSPPDYDSAKRYKSDTLGLTVRNMTYEVRQYFRRSPSDPGVIISKVEPGSKASVAGLKPYELITHINEKPVMNVEEFQTLIRQPGEMRLEVKRWTRGRVVKVKIEGAASSSAPADHGPASNGPLEKP
jgi:serine protease Do